MGGVDGRQRGGISAKIGNDLVLTRKWGLGQGGGSKTGEETTIRKQQVESRISDEFRPSEELLERIVSIEKESERRKIPRKCRCADPATKKKD